MKNKNEHDLSKAIMKQYLKKVLSIKYYYIICFVLFVAAALLYNKYSTKVYQITSTIGPVHNNQTSLLASNSMFQGAGSYSQMKNIEDDINSLSSFSLISSTVNNMNLEVGYFAEKNNLLKQTTEVFQRSPFFVVIDKSHIQPIRTRFYITPLNDSTFLLSVHNKNTTVYNYIDNYISGNNLVLNLDTICKFNTTLSSRYFKLSISKNRDYVSSSDNGSYRYFFELYHLEELSKLYVRKLNIQPISVMASLIKIQFVGENIEKSISFLNNYINAFLEESLAKKNKIARNTIQFIDNQISQISDSLIQSESKLKNFRTANQVTDLSFQGQRIYEQMEQIEAERASLEVQKRYYNSTLNYFKTNQDVSGVMPPISANITDPILNTLYTDLLALNSERSDLIASAKGKNIFLGQVENKIKLQKQAIIENATNNLNTINLTLNELDYRVEKLTNQISSLPVTEMNMVNIQRKFDLNDANYTYLLQKRIEAAITLSSNYPEFEVLEPARVITSEIIKPKLMMNYLIALFLALLIPSSFLVIREFFNDKITSDLDIRHMTNKPLLGTIYSNKNGKETFVVESPRTAMAESFRHLRSNLFNKLKSDQPKTVLITSSQPGDGKSFISLNLAASIASAGFKTILIDCDLRHPTLHYKFGNDNSSGLSNYFTRDKKLNEVIQTSELNNLYFIPAGPVLPNASELLESGILGQLIETLESEFTYIIIDTSPLGLVADAIRMMKHASHILIVSRNNYTKKTILSNVLSSLDSDNINNYDLVLNDLNLKESNYSRYSKYYLKG